MRESQNSRTLMLPLLSSDWVSNIFDCYALVEEIKIINRNYINKYKYKSIRCAIQCALYVHIHSYGMSYTRHTDTYRQHTPHSTRAPCIRYDCIETKFSGRAICFRTNTWLNQFAGIIISTLSPVASVQQSTAKQRGPVVKIYRQTEEYWRWKSSFLPSFLLFRTQFRNLDTVKK